MLRTELQPEIREFPASDGYRFRYRHWRPGCARPMGYLVALHGIQSHSGWYEFTSRHLCEEGYDVRFLDRRGSGMNEGSRGDVIHSDRWINDVAQMLGEVRHERNQVSPACPVILLGLSWGGKLAVVTANRHPHLVDALVLLYPGICARIRPRWYQKLEIALAQLAGFHHIKVPIPLDDPALFTQDPQWQEYIRTDAFALREVTIDFLAASCELDRLAILAPETVRCPVLLQLAGKDRIIDNPATQAYFNRFPSLAKQLRSYHRSEHTLEFEPDREQYIADLIRWLNTLQSPC